MQAAFINRLLPRSFLEDILTQAEQSNSTKNPIFAWLSATVKTCWAQLTFAESNSSNNGKKSTSWLGTLALFGVNILGALVLAHLLILIYMHENNFYAYDFVLSAGMALELMYIQFELIGLALAMTFAGSIPFGLYLLSPISFDLRHGNAATHGNTQRD